MVALANTLYVGATIMPKHFPYFAIAFCILSKHHNGPVTVLPPPVPATAAVKRALE